MAANCFGFCKVQKGDRLHFLAEFEDFRRSRVREFLGGTASRIFFFRLDIPPYVPERAQPLSHFLLTPDRPRGSGLGLISRNQYDQRSTPKAKPPHISEPRLWTTPPASATSWSPTTPFTDVRIRSKINFTIRSVTSYVGV